MGMKIMDIPGMNKSHDSGFIIDYGLHPSRMYIKFMSDAGVTDDQNGLTFAAYMRERGHKIEHVGTRSYVISTADMLKEFK